MSRDLTDRESDVLVAMIERGEPVDPADPVVDADRRTWLQRVPVTMAGARCTCGTCPSIELVTGGSSAGDPPRRGGPSAGDRPRRVLSAHVPGALLLLFVDGGVPSYLELAPIADTHFAEFPPATELGFCG